MGNLLIHAEEKHQSLWTLDKVSYVTTEIPQLDQPKCHNEDLQISMHGEFGSAIS
jgi:hypothetical protein